MFRVTSAAANVTVVIYLAKVHGVSLTSTALVTGPIVAAAVSATAVGLPAQVSFRDNRASVLGHGRASCIACAAARDRDLARHLPYAG